MKVSLFSSASCQECKKIRPVMKRMASRYGFEYEDYVVESGVEPFIRNGVTGTPVMIVFDGEVEKGRFTGHQTETSIERFLQKFGVIK